MATGAGNKSVSGLGDGTMQWLDPLKLIDESGNTIFAQGANNIQAGLTAHAGGTQAAALALSATQTVHVVSVCATNADSVVLPASTGRGAVHIISNQGAATLQLYGLSTDTINAVAAATGIAVTTTKSAYCIDYAAGTWLALVG